MSRRRDDPLVGALVGLIDLPLWVSVMLGAFAFLALTFLPPLYAETSFTGGILARTLPRIAPLVLAACLLAGLAGVVRRNYRQVLPSRTRDAAAIRSLAWPKLELVVGQAYRARRYAVTERGGGQPDGGIDLELRGNGEYVLVQCKQWKRQVGVEKVRELLGVVTESGADRGVLVAPGGFTLSALTFAAGQPLELIDADGMLELMGISEALSTTDAATSDRPRAEPPACPTCGRPMVKRVARKGADAGSVFWGCSTFPACRGTRAA